MIQLDAFETIGVFLLDEGGRDIASDEFRVSITAEQNGRLWPMPSTSKLSSATRIFSIAEARSGPHVHSFAIIGS